MMLSRVAEKLYWMTRFMERAEDTSRLINAVTLMTLDMPGDATFGWDSLLKVAGLDELFFEHYPEANESAVMRFLIQDERNPSSIMTCIAHARENTRTFREVLPWESWEWVNELYLFAKKALPGELDRRQRYEVLQGIIRRRQSIVGLLSGTMSSDDAYQFLRLGRNIERADMTSRILDVSHAVILPTDTPAGEQYNDLLWMNILKALSAYQMYRRHISVHASSTQVIGLLLHDLRFPRTINHCLTEIADVVQALPQPESVMVSVRTSQDMLASANSEALAKAGLHEFIDQLQIGLTRIDTALRERYFRLPEIQRPSPSAEGASDSE
ncbi:alpha-E domain-containing protein [Sulfurirhabdus autotrophica]|uniref:Putative alpha-E superfamily protein n=1 Tax=Sulfurirhabdus autotrophica TaxID=1706046 RepID=A0A4R3XV73_9PROT|nr:alpha-E domain-containing protein [Sulfurirhabdus autotrophica]TCV79276.1 putative alpha-E superfamily protein [Sulfurirhabdus autotrophica]